MSIDLKALSPKQLDELIAQAEDTKRRLHRERLSDARRKVLQVAKDEGYTIEELFGIDGKKARGTGKTVAPKFRNPADPEKTWTGRGKRPRWFVDALASGKTADDMRV